MSTVITRKDIPSYISKIAVPGFSGSSPIAHSTIGSCRTEPDVGEKLVDTELSDSFTIGDLFDGLTINVFFQYSNALFNNNLSLTFNAITTEESYGIPIIASVLYNGSSTQDDEAIFAYPKWGDYDIVTFVYKEIPIQSQKQNDYGKIQNEDKIPVQQAINVQPVQSVFPGSEEENPKKKDFNDGIYVKSQIAEIFDLSSMNNGMGITSSIGGILEVIPIRDTLVVQRVTTNQGAIYQRELYVTEGSPQQSDQANMPISTNIQTKTELPHTITNMSEDVGFCYTAGHELPSKPESGTTYYNLVLAVSSGGYEIITNPLS